MKIELRCSYYDADADTLVKAGDVGDIVDVDDRFANRLIETENASPVDGE